MKKLSNSKEPEFKKGLTEEEINSPEFNPDDFAPAPEKDGDRVVNEGLENKRNSLVFAFIATVLALIVCFTGWGVSAAKVKYENKLLEKEVLSVFENCDRFEKYALDMNGYDVYAVFFKNKMAGYVVLGETEGFGGTIRFGVAFNSNNMISNIKVLDHNESMGLGSKITKDAFLSQFYGVLIGNSSVDFDLISGATTSSNAVGRAVCDILGLTLSTDSIAKELGYETISEEEIEEEIKKDEEEDKTPVDTTDPAETTGKPRPDGSGGGSNVNQGNGDEDMNIDGEDETTVYETETEETEDSTAETEDEETTKAPDTTEKVEDTTVPEDTTTIPEDTTSAPEETTQPPEETTGPDNTTEETTGVADSEDPVTPVDGEEE